jgi:chemotaxis protein MotB
MTLVAMPGCADNSMVVQGRMQGLQQQQLALTRQNEELQSRASALDRNNQELEKLIAQTRQGNKVLEDQVGVLREQLTTATTQLARIRDEKKSTEQKVQTLTASMQRQGGVMINPNNSYLRSLPTINLPDVNVRRDGDVIRVDLPASLLFEPGMAQLRTPGVQTLGTVANTLAQEYSNQIIGIEGHTDSDPVRTNVWRNNNHLSVARATTVYDFLTAQTKLQPKQLFVVGHGANHPVVSNATPAGKQRNARIELVIYPETAE